jgi:hypothetical protein
MVVTTPYHMKDRRIEKFLEDLTAEGVVTLEHQVLADVEGSDVIKQQEVDAMLNTAGGAWFSMGKLGETVEVEYEPDLSPVVDYVKKGAHTKIAGAASFEDQKKLVAEAESDLEKLIGDPKWNERPTHVVNKAYIREMGEKVEKTYRGAVVEELGTKYGFSATLFVTVENKLYVRGKDHMQGFTPVVKYEVTEKK